MPAAGHEHVVLEDLGVRLAAAAAAAVARSLRSLRSGGRCGRSVVAVGAVAAPAAAVAAAPPSSSRSSVRLPGRSLRLPVRPAVVAACRRSLPSSAAGSSVAPVAAAVRALVCRGRRGGLGCWPRPARPLAVARSGRPGPVARRSPLGSGRSVAASVPVGGSVGAVGAARALSSAVARARSLRVRVRSARAAAASVAVAGAGCGRACGRSARARPAAERSRRAPAARGGPARAARPGLVAGRLPAGCSAAPPDWPPDWPPAWAALIASTSWLLRMPPAPLMPRPPAICLSSGSSMPESPAAALGAAWLGASVRCRRGGGGCFGHVRSFPRSGRTGVSNRRPRSVWFRASTRDDPGARRGRRRAESAGENAIRVDRWWRARSRTTSPAHQQPST